MIRNPDSHNEWLRPITGDNDPPDKAPSGGGGSPNSSLPPSSDGLVMDSDGLVTAETPTSDGSDGSDGIFQTYPQSEQKSEMQETKIDLRQPEIGIEASNSPQSTESYRSQGLQPSLVSITDPSQPITNHHNTPLTHHSPLLPNTGVGSPLPTSSVSNAIQSNLDNTGVSETDRNLEISTGGKGVSSPGSKQLSPYTEGATPTVGRNNLVGKVVTYIGKQYVAQYKGLKLIIQHMHKEVADVLRVTCELPDGRFTTRIPLQDLQFAT
jgi:hypothetical protein